LRQVVAGVSSTGWARRLELAFLADGNGAAAEGRRVTLGRCQLDGLGLSAAVAAIAGSSASARALQTIEHAEVGPSRGLVGA
jgi:hypothetical protein